MEVDIKQELQAIESNLALMRGRAAVLAKQLEDIELKSAQIEGAAMYLRGKAAGGEESADQPGDDLLTDLKTV